MAGKSGGLGELASTYILDPIRKAMGTYIPDRGETELPEQYISDRVSSNFNPFEGFRRSTYPANIPTNIPSYRADERKGTLETLPQSRFDARSPLKSDVNYWQGTSADKKSMTPEIKKMYAYARVAGAARKLGLPSVDPDQFAAMVLKEGRPDGGFNSFIPEAKPDIEFRKRLDQYNIPDWQKGYLGMINYAQRIATKRDIPFEAVWNGLGKNYKGQTGFDYAKAVKAHQQAVLNPKNAEFRSFVHRAFSEGSKFGLPAVKEKTRDTDPFLKSDPQYKYHTPDGMLRKAGGGIVIDDGNPAKQRKLI
jgi:hypothetical protein